jgi:hypothetical protein
LFHPVLPFAALARGYDTRTRRQRNTWLRRCTHPHQHFPVLFVSMIPLAYSSARGATIFVLPYFLLFTYTYTHTHPHTFYLPIRPVHRTQSKHPIAALLPSAYPHIPHNPKHGPVHRLQNKLIPNQPSLAALALALVTLGALVTLVALSCPENTNARANLTPLS